MAGEALLMKLVSVVTCATLSNTQISKPVVQALSTVKVAFLLTFSTQWVAFSTNL